MFINQLTQTLENWAPLSLQESYDNAGLLIGRHDQEVRKALICLDVTEVVMDEAIEQHCDMVIAHHPLIFKGMKKLNGANEVERCTIKAIQHQIAVYAIHTNLDNVASGVNAEIARRLQLQNTKILSPMPQNLLKLTTFVPHEHLQAVSSAVFAAGAGTIGDYDSCGYILEGKGSFRALEGANPFVGQKGQVHQEPESRLETVVPKHALQKVLSALFQAHPYEEVAYDVYPLENTFPETGAGMIGELTDTMNAADFVDFLKKQMDLQVVKATPLLKKGVRKVAFCGGSGAFLIPTAIQQGADVYITGDIKYHEFFQAEDRLTLFDIGHYESERFTIDLLYQFLREKFPTFALLKSQVNTNPVNYL